MALLIVATPIGNLKDITINALETLKQAHLILAENTLTTNNLLLKHSIVNKTIINYTDHTKEEDIIKFLEQAKNYDVCLVSDAGTPIISDPGYLLIKKAHEMGIKIHTLPGPSSLTSAISVCGLPSYNFSFLGFFETSKITKLKLLLNNEITVAFFIPARDIIKILKQLEVHAPNNIICIARELTKIFEDIKTGTIQELQNHYSQNDKQRGEAVLIISHLLSETKSIDLQNEIQKTLEKKPFLNNLSKKDLAEVLKSYEENLKNFSKKEIYNIILKILD